MVDTQAQPQPIKVAKKALFDVKGPGGIRVCNKEQADKYAKMDGYKVVGPHKPEPVAAPKVVEPLVTVDDDTEEVEVTDYSDHSVKELKAACKESSIKGYSKMGRDDLVEALENHELNQG